MSTTIPAKRLGKYQVNGPMLEITNTMAGRVPLDLPDAPTKLRNEVMPTQRTLEYEQTFAFGALEMSD
ncbi:unnamed protein product [Protopolystoma xenopodis]|uniref:Uncharacterized protein n=1 Tax=Protopolystoma xenopodis TaxID=117903 RepID=A0A448XB24_9PLAT|nr:unnamed protein product [Protopolystoma xenopodis]